MAQKILIKRSNSTGNYPDNTQIDYGELAINTYDGSMFMKLNDGSNSVVALHHNPALHYDTSNTRIGIGTTTPTSLLQVKQSANTAAGGFEVHDTAGRKIQIYGTGSSGQQRIMTSGTTNTFVVGTTAAGALQFKTTDTARMTVLSGGNVGIRTETPSEKLHINGGTSEVALRVDTTNADAKIRLTTLGQQDWSIGVDYSDSGKFKIAESGNIATLTALTIDNQRNVGIGTSSPEGLLHLKSSTDYDVVFDYTGQEKFKIRHGSSGLYLTGPDTNSLAFGVDQNHDTRMFNTSGAGFAMFKASTSRVGIGTDSPQSLLHVSHATAPTFRLSRTGTGQVWVQSIDSNGRLHIQEAASEGGTQNTRLKIDDTGEITFNEAYTFPTSDGSANQVLQTDGSGNLSFSSSAGGGVSISNNANNRVLTGDGTNANAEANLTFDGSNFAVTGNASTTGGLTVGDSSADVLRFTGLLNHGSGSGTTIIDDGRRLQNLSAHNYSNVSRPGSDTSITSSRLHSSRGTYIANVPFGDSWHDVFAHRRHYTWIYETSTNGSSFSSATINENIFDHNDETEYQALTSTIKAVRWTVTNISYNLAEYINLGVKYSASSPAFSLKVESSTDGTNYTDRLVTTNASEGSSTYWFKIDGYAGASHLRITLAKQDLTNTNGLDISRLGLWTPRPGDQGKSKTDHYPFDYVRREQLNLIDNQKLQLGTSQDLRLYHDSFHSYVYHVGAGDLRIRGNDLLLQNDAGEDYLTATSNGAVSLYHDNQVKLATTSSGIGVTGNIANTSGDMTLDVAGDITLDAGGANINFNDDGTAVGHIEMAGSNLEIKSKVSDKDIIFKGNDGGSAITALTLDMSAAGFATFNSGVTGTSGFFQNVYITSSGESTTNRIDNDGTQLYMTYGGSSNRALEINNSTGAVTLKHGTNTKLATTSTGVDISGNLDASGTVFFNSDLRANNVSNKLIVKASSTTTELHSAGSTGIVFKDSGNGQIASLDTSGNLTVGGNLIVNGSTTTLNTATLDVEDKNITLNKGSGDTSSNADGAGITIQDAVNDSTDATFTWDASNDDWVLSHDLQLPTKIRHTGDLDNYFSFANTDTQSFVTGNSTRLQITNSLVRFNQENNNQDFQVQSVGTDNMLFVDASANKVGIGTNAPNRELEIKTTSGTASLRVHADHESSPRTALEFMRGTSDTFGGDAFTDWKIGHVGNDQADFAIISHDSNRGENERVTVEYTTGNVGIGEISPDRKLHVKDSNYRIAVFERTGAPNGYVMFADPNTTQDVGLGATTNDLKFRSGNVDHLSLLGSNGHLKFTDFDQQLEFGSTSNKLGYNQWLMSASGGASIKNVAGPLTINPDDFTAFQVNDVEVSRIDATGIGYGTTPLTNLDVAKGLSGVSSLNARTVALFQGSNTAGATISISGKNTGYSGIFFGDQDSETTGQLQFDHTTNSFKFISNGGDRVLTILSNGKVGIVEDEPDEYLVVRAGNYSANVNGGIAVQAGHHDGSHWKSAFKIKSDGSGIARTAIDATTGQTSGQVNEAISIDTAGKVGIGTSSPATKLHVFTAGHFKVDTGASPIVELANNSATSSTSGTATLKFTQANTQAGGKIVSGRDGDYSNGSTRQTHMAFYTATAASDTEKMRIDSAGRVLIGTTSSLHASADLQIQGASGNYARIMLKDQDGTSQHAFIDETGGNLVITSQNGTSHGPIRFSTYDGTDTLERMRVHSNGYVGVGTNAPTAKFNVYATSTIGWSNLANSYILAGTTTAGIGIDSNEIATKGDHVYFGTIDNKDIVFRTNGANARMTIKGDGDIAIGYSTPDRRLDVRDESEVNGEVIQVRGGSSRGAVITYHRAGSYSWEAGIGGASSQDANIPASYWGVGERGASGRPARLLIAHTSGNVGIGATPQTSGSTKLRIGGTGDPHIRIEDLDGTNQYVNLGHNNGDTTYVSRNNTSHGKHTFYSYNGTTTTQRLQIQADGAVNISGNVGIGTANPARALHIGGAGHLLFERGGEVRSKDTSGNEKTLVRVNSSNQLEYGWSGAGPVKFMGGGSYTERMRIHTNANIGINDIAPHGTLTVTGPRILVQRTNDDSSIAFANNATGAPSSHAWAAGLNYSNSHAFTIAYGSGAVPSLESHKFVIKTDGKVGIGTDNPGQKLDVAGIIRSYATNPQVRIHTSSGTGTGYLVFGDSADDDVGQVFYSHSNDQMGFVVGGGSADVTIDADGDLTTKTRIAIGDFPATNNNSNNNDTTEANRVAPLHIRTTANSGAGTQVAQIIENYANDYGTTPLKLALDFKGQDSNNATNFVRLAQVSVNDTDYGDNNEATSHFIMGMTANGSYAERFMFHSHGHLGIGSTTAFHPTNQVNTGGHFKPDVGGKFLNISGGSGGAFINLMSSTTTNEDQVGGIYFTRTAGQADAHKQIAGIDAVRATYTGNDNLAGGDLRFFTKPNGNATAQPRMRIIDSGVIEFLDDSGNTDMYWDKTDLRLNDSNRIRLGTSGDLQLYHDGNESFIRDTGDGPLAVDTNGTEIRFISGGSFSNGKMARMIVDGAVELYHDNNKKLETTSTGVTVTGLLSATTKSFDIPHPSKEGMRLKHGVVEGPEHSVYVRGKSKEKVILLPDYWPDLIHEDTITVQLTAIGGGQELYVEDIKDNKIYVNGENYFYYIQAERKDVDRFEVEYEG